MGDVASDIIEAMFPARPKVAWILDASRSESNADLFANAGGRRVSQAEVKPDQKITEGNMNDISTAAGSQSGLSLRFEIPPDPNTRNFFTLDADGMTGRDKKRIGKALAQVSIDSL